MPNFQDRFTAKACAGLTAGLMLIGIVPALSAVPAQAASADLLLAAANATSWADAGNGSALMYWTPTEGATGYQVKVYNATTGALVSTRPSTTTTIAPTLSSYALTSLVNGTSYNLVLVAKTASGDFTYPAVAVTPKAVANRPALSTTVVGASGQLTFKWTAATVPTGTPAITGYQLTLTPNDGSAPIVKDLGNVLTDTVTGLIDGVLYKATLRSVNPNGLSYASTSVVVGSPSPIPVAVTNLVGARSSDGTSVDVSWSAPANAPAAAVSKYVVSFTSTNGAKAPASKVLYRAADGTIPTFATVTGLVSTGSYNVRVLAYSNAGTGVWSAYTRVSSPGAYAASVNPSQAAVTSTSVKLAWRAAVTGLNTPDVTGYRVTMTPVLGGTPVVHELGNVLTDTFTGLTEGTLYAFAVQAVNANGVGPISTAPAKIAPSVKALAPTNVAAVRSSDPTLAEVSWNAPTNQPGASITKYIVTVASTNGSPVPAAKTIARAADGTTATHLVLTGLAATGAYTVKVTPYSSAGTGVASSLTAIPVTNTAVAPDAPTSVVAAPGDAQVAVAWSAPLIDGGAPVSDYAVEFSADGGASWTRMSKPASTATSVAVTGLDNGTSYSFRVAAVNSVGLSPFSTVVSASPVAPAIIPSEPLALSGIPAMDSVALTWQAPASANASSYFVEYKGLADENWIAAGDTSALEFTVTGLAPSTPYQFHVIALSSQGRTGEVSAPASVTTLVDPANPNPGGGGAVIDNPSIGTGGDAQGTLVVASPGASETPAMCKVQIARADGTFSDTGIEVPLPAGANVCEIPNFTPPATDAGESLVVTVLDLTNAGIRAQFPIKQDQVVILRNKKTFNAIWSQMNANFASYAAANSGATYRDFFLKLPATYYTDDYANKVMDFNRALWTRTLDDSGMTVDLASANSVVFDVNKLLPWQKKLIIDNASMDMLISGEGNHTVVNYAVPDADPNAGPFILAVGTFNDQTGLVSASSTFNLADGWNATMHCSAFLGNGKSTAPDGASWVTREPWGLLDPTPAWRTASTQYSFDPVNNSVNKSSVGQATMGCELTKRQSQEG